MANQFLEVKKIIDGIYHISEPYMVCSTLIIGKDKALLFDTGYGTWDLKYTIEKLTDLPIIVVNSHGHGDHINGNYQFNQIYIHKDDIQLAKNYSTPQIKNLIIKTFMEHNAIFAESFSQEEYINGNDAVTYMPIEEGHIFDLGARKLEVIHLPGHTKGCIALFDKENKILLGGDSISQHVWMFLEESSSMSTYIESLKKVNQIDFDKIVASHSTEPFNKDIIDKLIHCALHIDVAKSNPYSSPMVPIEGLIYAEGGEPFVNPNSISIVFTKDKL